MAALASLHAAGEGFASRGHFVDGRPASIFTNDVASGPYASRYLREGFPVGSLLVERHRGRSDEPGALFVMIKHERGYFPAGGEWEYAAVRADGTVEDRGVLATCARCHAEAPSDWVFRGP